MLNIKIVNIIGIILFFLGISMIPSSLWSLAYSTSYTINDSEIFDFIAILTSSLITIVVGLLLYLWPFY